MKEEFGRRSFFKRMAASGALIATSQLPTFAQDDPAVFPKRGGNERLSLSYATVEIGLEKPFSILHISDTHLTSAYPTENDKKQQLTKNRTQCFGGRQEEALRDSLAWAKENVEYVLHTGDLIDWQSEANYDLAKKYFGQSIMGCIGNHEYSPDMWMSNPKESHTEGYKDNTRKTLQSAYPFNVKFQAWQVNGVNFICLDDVYGYVLPEQVALFKEEVKKGLPIILCMHVPFFTDKIWRCDMRFWSKKPFKDATLPAISGDYLMQKEEPITRDFIAYLKKEPLLKAILSGHLHITIEDRFSETAMEYVTGGNFLFSGREVLFF